MFKNLSRGALLAACVAASPAFVQTAAGAPSAPLKAAFVYVSPIGQAGWTYQHEQGRLAMEKALGAAVKTTVVEAVPEGADS